MEPLFAFAAVGLDKGGTTILDDISVDLPARMLTVIAGASGAGKSSLLRLCNRLEVPTSGQVLFRRTPIDAIDPLLLRRRVGMVFQRPVLFGGTVRDNLLVAAPDAGPDQLLPTLDLVELDRNLLDRSGDDLSGGEAQRVCLARALIAGPDTLLMDEPTSSLHPAARAALEATTRDLMERAGIDIVWVTHDLDQIGRLADHLIVLAAGRIAYHGAPNTGEARQALDVIDAGATS
jgi:putative ABC transport system ATP-binding protein